jgi:RNA polymerase sigma factor (sigma-70 family)
MRNEPTLRLAVESIPPTWDGPDEGSERESAERIQLVQALTRHHTLIQSYAYAITRDLHLSEDVFQDVAIVVAECWEDLPTGESLVPWLRETTRRKALEALRKQRRAAPLLPEALLAKLEDSFVQEEAQDDSFRDLQAALARCLGKLARVARSVVEARWGEGLSCLEIGARIGRSVQGVYAITKRSRFVLTQCLDRTRPTQGMRSSP